MERRVFRAEFQRSNFFPEMSFLEMTFRLAANVTLTDELLMLMRNLSVFFPSPYRHSLKNEFDRSLNIVL